MLYYGILQDHTLVIQLIFLPLALLIDACVGQSTIVCNSKDYVKKMNTSIIDWFDAKLNRVNRSAYDLRVRGLLTSLVLIMLSGLTGFIFLTLGSKSQFVLIFELALLLMLVEQKSIFTKIRRTNLDLRNGNVKSAFSSLGGVPENIPKNTDVHGIARNATENIAVLLTSRLIAPVFWYLLCGIVGILIYHIVWSLNYSLVERNDRTYNFGYAPRKLYSILIVAPGLLSGLLTVIACLFVPRANPLMSLKYASIYTFRPYKTNYQIPLSAFAGAFDLALRIQTQETNKGLKWIGTGTAKMQPNDVQRGLYLYIAICLINIFCIVNIILIVDIF